MSWKSTIIVEGEEMKLQIKTITQEKEEIMNKEQNEIRKEQD